MPRTSALRLLSSFVLALPVVAQSPDNVTPPSNITPHFGSDGSQLTSYVPGKSMFVRSVFLSLGLDLPEYAHAFEAAQVNTLESGFYIEPGNNYSRVADWENAFQGNVIPIETAANTYGFNIILTGDDIARGSNAVYDAVSGPSAAWNPNPITYAFTWARNLGKVIGVEMVDEISSSFAVPFPQGQLGKPGGPQKISCVNDLCTVTWPSQAVIQNGTLQFLVTGATSNPNLNRPATNLYHQNSQFVLSSSPNQDGFTFNSTGVGTQTFTTATDPNLTMEMFAALPEPNASSSDYIHNNAFRQIMSYINAVPGRPSVTWPAAAAAPRANFGAWAGPGAADYADIYFTFLSSASPTTYGLSDGLVAFNTAWNAKYPFVQAGKPTLMEVSNAGVIYNIVPASIPITSFDGTTMTFSQPHGIVNMKVGVTRLTLSGDSNSSLNGNYYVYNVVNPYAVEVYPASPMGPTMHGVTVTFSDGQVLKVAGDYSGNLTSNGIGFAGAPYCVNQQNFGQVATISNSSYAPYNGKWYVLPESFDNLIGTSTCTWFISLRPLMAGQSSTGGVAAVIADNYYHPGVSTVAAPAVTPDVIAANIMYAAEKGAAGVRVYAFGRDADSDQGLNACFAPSNCGTQDNANPFYNGAEAQARWQGMSNAFNLIHEIEPYLLQPKLPSPDYGPSMITGARTSSYGTLLMMTEFATSARVVNVDLSAYNPSGGTGTMYTMTGEELKQESVSGSSKQVTFAPGETVAFTFPAANQIVPRRQPPIRRHRIW